MNVLRLAVILSLLVNVAALAGLAARWPRTPMPAAVSPAQLPVSAHERTQITPRDWQDLNGLPPAEHVQYLRERGWPPAVVRAVISAQLELQYGPQRLALQREQGVYWRSHYHQFGIVEPEQIAARAELRRLYREQHDKLRSLLGEDALSPRQQADLSRRFGPIAPEKHELLSRIVSDYNELLSQARESGGRMMLPEDREVLRLLEQEREADIAALLTPEEQQAYEMRASSTANQLQFQLRAFNPTEEEYIALFELQKRFNDRFGGSHPTDEQRQQRQAAIGELNQQIAQVLGEERFADYELKTHRSWLQTERWVQQQALPPESITNLARLTRDMETRIQELKENSSLSAADRTARQNALYQESLLRLSQILPSHQLDAYQQGPGRWMRPLQPRTR